VKWGNLPMVPSEEPCVTPGSAPNTLEVIDLREEANVTTLRKSDRCDKCGAQAFFLAMKGDDHDLLFCAHHGREHFDALVLQGWEVVASTGETNEDPAMSESVI